MREVTMLFADLRGFTPMVEEALPPKDVVKIMNRYFVEMSAAIREQKRLVLQYIGGGDRVIYSRWVIPSTWPRAFRVSISNLIPILSSAPVPRPE